jgi:phenol hydroxylase P0 protein
MAKLKAVEQRSAQAGFDALRKYVRVRNTRSGFVEFDFAIGDPSLYVELVLPEGAFREFCERNAVVMMSDEEAAAVDEDMDKWRYGDLRPGQDDPG